MLSKTLLADYLESAGISINGAKPHDVQILNDKLYQRMKLHPSLAAGEAYMDGWWECDKLDEFFYRICKHTLDSKLSGTLTKSTQRALNALLNLQTKARSLKVAKEHYNIGNAFYKAMLGPSMAYTCGYWKDAKTLDEAQYNKFDLICRKIDIKKGERVLELGCGWGSFAKYAAENYGCEVVAVNISEEQIKFARETFKGLPLQFFQCDYRDHQIYNKEQKLFDKVVSVGLCEHVGFRNYRNFAETICNNMKEDGLALVHTIGKNITDKCVDPWISKYIFPNSIIPSLKLLGEAFENILILEDLHNFGADYDLTLMQWHRNFIDNWNAFESIYGKKFFRKWEYYLLSCAGAFRARTLQLWQMVLSPKGVPGGYKSIR